MNLQLRCLVTVFHLRECIIVFYDGKGKHVINVGSSRPDRHHILLCKHAEEFALKDIRKYMSKTKNNRLKNIKIIIWKQNKNGIIRSVNCCSWCKKTILKSNLCNSQIITPCVVNDAWNGHFQTAIVEHAKNPVMKTKL